MARKALGRLELGRRRAVVEVNPLLSRERFAFRLERHRIAVTLGLARLQDDIARDTRVADAARPLGPFDIHGPFREGFDLPTGVASELERAISFSNDVIAELLDPFSKFRHVDRVDEAARLVDLLRVQTAPFAIGEPCHVRDEEVVMKLGHRPVLAVDRFA